MRTHDSVIHAASSYFVALFVAHDWQRVRRAIDRLRSSAPEAHRNLSLHLQQLLVSGEDHRHGRHPGFDLVAILRAMVVRFTSGSRQGASTIDQQLVRTLSGRYEWTLRRKIREILLAVLLKRHVPASELPALYLMAGYYGWRMNGLRQACVQLRIDPAMCTLSDAASLVARLKYPQSRVMSAKRALQIATRVAHLLRLRERHLQDGTYAYLAPEPSIIVDAATARESTAAVSTA